MTKPLNGNVGRAPRGTGYELRGDNREFLAYTGHESMLSGPADTAKTFTGCIKMHAICLRAAGAQGAVVRKFHNSLVGSVLKTFAKVVAPYADAPRVLGGTSPERYIYRNGSCIWVGGMDDPNKVLSSERDFIYVNQAEELTLGDWETLATRCSGRGAVVKHPQLMGDCNPGGSRHWIRLRAQEGKLRLFVARHKDNPTIYTADGNVLPDGLLRLKVLDNLSGIRQKRLRDGIWATAEGAVYDMFDHAVHVTKRPESEMVKWYLCQDEGFTNPAALLLVGEDSDGRWHVQREFYKRGVLQADVVKVAEEWFREKRCEMDAVDEAAAALIAALNNAGVWAVGGKGRILDGIYIIQDRLQKQADDRPRLTVDPECINTINEFESYVWKPEKDVPVDADNHCFVGETKILTKEGWKRIDAIKSGEYVLSPFGWSKVYESACSGIKIVKDYGFAKCTPDHKILTDRGLIEVDALRYFDKIMVWQKTKQWSLMEFLTGVIHTGNKPTESLTMPRFILGALRKKACQAAAAFCIATYGNTIKAKFLTEWKCITRTTILGIIALAIWSLLLMANMLAVINGVIGMAWKNIFPVFGIWRLRKHLELPIQNLEGTDCRTIQKSNGLKKSKHQPRAKYVANNTSHRFLVEAGSVVLIAECERLGKEGIRNLNRINHAGIATLAPTFNLNTEFGCYFANGVLVGNSLGALRYLADVIAVPTGAWDVPKLELPPLRPATDEIPGDGIQWPDLSIDMGPEISL